MNIHALIRDNYRNGWAVRDRIPNPTLTLTLNYTDFTGELRFDYDKDYRLGAELQIILYNPTSNTQQTLWIGTITEKRYQSHSPLISYRIRGLGEHLLDLPFPYQDIPKRTRNPNAQTLCETILKRYLQQHTSRYTITYDLPITSLDTDQLQFRTVADLYKLLQSLTPTRLRAEPLQNGRIRWYLEPPPNTTHYLPDTTQFELTTHIHETATRLTLEPPAQQLIKDRRITNPEFWRLEIPTLFPPINASISPNDPNEYGYFAPTATRIDTNYDPYLYDPINGDIWITLKYTDKIKVPRDLTGNRLTLTIGAYIRGQNFRARWRINNINSTYYEATAIAPFIEMPYTIIPNTDELDIALQFRPAQAGPMYAVIDGVYLIPGDTPLNELSTPPFAPLTDQIYSFLTAPLFLATITHTSGSYPTFNITSLNANFTTDLINSPCEILHQNTSAFATITARPNPQTLTIQMNDPVTPTPGDILIIHSDPTELHYDTRYRTIETPAAATLHDFLRLKARFTQPAYQLQASIPYQPTQPIPYPGEKVKLGKQPLSIPPYAPPLEIQSTELTITNGTIQSIKINAGTPERTLRAFFRQTKHPTRSQL